MLASDPEQEIFIAVVMTALLMTLLVVIIVVAVVRYQNRSRMHLQEVRSMKDNFNRELLQAQVEIHDKTLLVVSQEIHDNVGQVLSLVKLNLNTVSAEHVSDDPGTWQKIEAAKELVGKAIKDLRNLSKSLNADFISSQLFSESFQLELNMISATGAIQTTLVIKGEERRQSPQSTLIIYRLFQESLHNIIKHAQARNIRCTLDYGNQVLVLLLTDDGKGFDPTTAVSAPTGMGLASMDYRTRLLGGKFDIISAPGKGTSVIFRIPYSV
jgi:signal transduction histidine kinase